MLGQAMCSCTAVIKRAAATQAARQVAQQAPAAVATAISSAAASALINRPAINKRVVSTQARDSATRQVTQQAPASALINLQVNGRPVQVAEGSTLLDAINQSGSHVPTLCYHPEFEPRAVCRMCLVDVKGSNKPLPACRTKAEEGYVITTDPAWPSSQRVHPMRSRGGLQAPKSRPGGTGRRNVASRHFQNGARVAGASRASAARPHVAEHLP